MRDLLVRSNPLQYSKVLAQVFHAIPGNWAAKAAIDIALMDWVGQKFGVPLYTLFGLDPADTPLTTFSIGIDTPEITKQKTREAEAYPVLKVKVGLDTDEATIEAIRSVTRKPLRVDANEGWKTKEEAVRKINWLETQGVEFIEQPLPADQLEDVKYIRDHIHMPVIADEACQHAADIPKLARYYDGVNIKLDKSGGVLEAYRMIQIAKSLGHEDHAGLHDIELGDLHRRRAAFATGGLRRSRRQSADRQRPLSRRPRGEGETRPAQRPRPGPDKSVENHDRVEGLPDQGDG